LTALEEDDTGGIGLEPKALLARLSAIGPSQPWPVTVYFAYSGRRF